MINYKIVTRHLSKGQKSAIKNCFGKVLTLWPSSASLSMVALKHGTDKWTHSYIPNYEKHFAALRFKKLNILEIGIGGYADPKDGGHSLRMWKEYFPKSTIYGLDLYDKTALEEERIRIFQGSQTDAELLRAIAREARKLDIIIDDGSHVNEHIISSFGTLFPLLADGGIYVIEDMQTSYNPKYGGSSEDLDHPGTSTGMLKQLIDGLNHQWIAGRKASYTDENIVSVQLYPKMAFIFKGANRHDPRAQDQVPAGNNEAAVKERQRSAVMNSAED
jgi:hypothetical protein